MSETASAPPRIRVASVPSSHPYVAAVTDPVAVDLLPDPPVAGAPAGRWWPPRVLEPDWVEAHAEDFDVLHVHFGLESQSPESVVAALDAARRADRRIVFTVHDLENPQLIDQSAYSSLLDEVVARADALFTLTDAAALAIAKRWGRVADVVPHPRLAAPAPSPQTPRATRRVGVHLRDLRPNIDGVRATATLVRAVAELRSAGVPVVAEVHLNARVRDESAAARIASLVDGRGGVELRRHERLDDDQLAAAIARLDALVLPYAWGTHSGWVELAYDAAVPVVGTRAGAFAAQHPWDYHVYDLGDPESLAAALGAATSIPWARPGAERVAEAERRAALRAVEGADVRAAHTALYRRLVAREVVA